LAIIIKFVLKNIWEKKLRTTLILVSIMLSAALYFATEALADTTKDMFVERMRVYYGTADLIIYPNQDSPSHFLYRNRAEQFADDYAYLAGSIETAGNLRINQENLRLFIQGFTLPELQKLNPFVLASEANLYPFRGKKVILSKQTAEEYGFKLGDYLELELFGSKRKFFVAALAEPVGPFQYDGQNITAVVPLDTLATILGVRGQVYTLYVKAKDPARKGELQEKLAAAYPRCQIRETITGREMEEYTKSLTTTFQMMGMVVLFMAVYIIYTSFKVITRERLPMIGTFRSIGATRRMTSWVLLTESLMYGLIGGLLGCVFGLGLLYLIIVAIRPAFMKTVAVSLQYSPRQLGAAMLLALVISFLSSLAPILKIAKIPVKEIIFNSISKSRKRKRWKPIVGVILIGSALFLPPYIPFHLFLPVSMVLIFASIIGFIYLTPLLTSLFLKVFARIYLHVFGNEGILAAKNLRGNKSVLNNISLLALGISSLLMINTISFSVAKEITDFYRDGHFAIWFWTPRADRTTEALLHRIDGVEGVCGIYTGNQIEITNRQERINLLHGINIHKYTDYWDFDLDPIILAQLDTGRNILITNTLRERLQVQTGDLLTLKTNRGERDYQIIGFFDSLMWNGSFALIAERYLKMDLYKQYYDDLFIKTSKDPDLIAAAIQQRFKRQNPYISTLEQMKASDVKNNASILNVMKGFALLALVIGIFGVFNNLIISFLERQRTLAIFRSVGMSRKQSIKVFFIEALTGGVIGGLIGTMSGYILISLSPLILKAVASNIPIHHSLSFYLLAIGAGIIITVTASTSPAFKSSKLNIVNAIKYE
jgi:putative ABC transport system permease protein